jgi:hypothetical protein
VCSSDLSTQQPEQAWQETNSLGTGEQQYEEAYTQEGRMYNINYITPPPSD